MDFIIKKINNYDNLQDLKNIYSRNNKNIWNHIWNYNYISPLLKDIKESELLLTKFISFTSKSNTLKIINSIIFDEYLQEYIRVYVLNNKYKDFDINEAINKYTNTSNYYKINNLNLYKWNYINRLEKIDYHNVFIKQQCEFKHPEKNISIIYEWADWNNWNMIFSWWTSIKKLVIQNNSSDKIVEFKEIIILSLGI